MKEIPSDIKNRLKKIDFDDDEINTLEKIHELKSRSYSFDIRRLINEVAAETLSNAIAWTFEKNKWNDRDFFDLAEKHRKEKMLLK